MKKNLLDDVLKGISIRYSILVYLQLFLFIGCMTVDIRPAIVEKNKSSRPTWTKVSEISRPFIMDEELRIVSFSLNKTTLEIGADTAFEKANKQLLDYWMGRYKVHFQSSRDRNEAYAIGQSFLAARDRNINFEVCDVYYEKRQNISILQGSRDDLYDTYLCLVIKNPDRLMTDIKNKINSSGIDFRVKEMLGH